MEILKANPFISTKKAGRKGVRLALAGICLASLPVLSGCTSAWDEESTERLRKECIRGTTQVNDPMPAQFCDCIVPKVQARYKTPAEADSLMKNPVAIAEFGAECRVAPDEVKADWTEHNIAMFLKSCEKLARQDSITAAGYCDCILEKVRRRYVTNTRMDAVNFERIRAIGRECLEDK